METTVQLKMNEQELAYSLRQACEQLSEAGEMTLDFSSVNRIDTVSLETLGTLAAAAEANKTKVKLLGVNSGIYKVLKLARLAGRFTY